jgi:transcription initiation factor IIE alpha subunit
MNNYTLPMNRWNLWCQNPECSSFFEQHAMEPNTTCSRCGGTLVVSEKFTFNLPKDDRGLRGN